MSGESPHFFSVYRHRVYLKLEDNLLQGAHTLTHPASLGLPKSLFLFNDKITRNRAIKVVHTGHRPNDSQKRAFLSEWIPGYTDEGAIEYQNTYGVAHAYIIDDTGNTVAGPYPVQLKVGPTTEEPVHGPFWNVFGDDKSNSNNKLKYYASLTQQTIPIQDVSIGNPGIVTASKHGLANGDLITIDCVDVKVNGSAVFNRF